jgi:hypothetical protein
MNYSLQQLQEALPKAIAAGSEPVISQIQAEINRLERMQRSESSPAMAAARAGAPYAVPYGTSMVPSREEAVRGTAAAARYGIPIATTVALGATGFGLPAAGYSLISGGFGETFAQFIEKMGGLRDKINPKEIGASGIASGSPLFKFSKAAGPFLSPGAASFLASTASSVTGGELARGLQTGEFLGEFEGGLDAATRLTAPILAGVSSRIGSESDAGIRRARAISAKRGGSGLFNPDGTIANVALSEANPALLGMESRNIANFNPAALDRLLSMDSNIANVAQELVAAAPEATPIAQVLLKYEGLSLLKAQSDNARKAAETAKELAENARKSYSADARQLMGVAEEAQRNSIRAKAAFDKGLTPVFGGKIPSLFETNPARVASEVQGVTADAVDAMKLSRTALYDATGIGLNDPIVDVTDVLTAGAKQAKSGVFSGNKAQTEFVEAVSDFFGDRKQIPYEEFLEFKNNYSKKLAGNSSDPKVIKAAEAKANAAYDIMKEASRSFIDRSYGADVLKNWDEATKAWSDSVSFMKDDAVQKLASGDFSGFYQSVKSGGSDSNAWKQVNNYFDYLSNLTAKAVSSGRLDPRDVAAAENFRKHVYGGLLLGVVEDSLVDGARKASLISGKDAIDPVKFAQNLAELESRGGFPVKKAFGAETSDVRKLARFIAEEHDGRMTREELTSWLKMIPYEGVELASNRLAYRKAVKDALVKSNIAERFDKVKQAERKYASAIGDTQKLSDDFNAVSSDPLVQFFSNTAFKLDTKDYANNARLVERIVSEVDPSVVKDFVSKANSSGRSDLVSQMGDVAASNAVRRFIPVQYQNKPMLKLKEITNLFFGQGDDIKRERESLKALIGNDRFNEIVKVVVEPIDEIARQRASLQTVRGQASNAFNDLRAISTIYGGAMGTMTTGMMAAQGGKSVIKALDSRMYNLVSQVYLNPKFSKNLQAVGYDLTKFAQMSPVYAAAVTAAMQADASQNPPNQ